MMKTGMKTKSILIKKYENRRLYDATNSRYVNLDEVAKMLQNGDNVRVVDANTGEDITRLILTQIIVEDAKGPDSIFPLDVLRQMVIASGRASQESALQYMKAVLDISQSSYRAMVPPFNPFEFIQQKDSTPARGPAPPLDAEAGESSAQQGKKPEAIEVDELKHRLAELETLVSKLSPGKAARKKRAASSRVAAAPRKRP
jgi:polyhydroxyalkanoate synthesis repressor PhaR